MSQPPPDRWHAGNSLQRGEGKLTTQQIGVGVVSLTLLGGVARDHGNLNRITDQKNLPIHKGGKGVYSPLDPGLEALS